MSIKVGDKVAMNSKYYVSDSNKGKEWVVKSEPFDLCGTKCVMLEGFSGGYALDGLTKVKVGRVKAYQCSKCKQLQENDIEDNVFCQCGIDPVPGRRIKAGKEECLKSFEEIEEGKRWHEKFSWEK